jgi:hypothetical protein
VEAHIQFRGSGNLKDVMNFALPSYLCDNLKEKKIHVDTDAFIFLGMFVELQSVTVRFIMSVDLCICLSIRSST